jgi:hypothetical protein
MTIYDIAGLEIGNDEELQRFFDKTYQNRKPANVLVVNSHQLSFLGDSYDVYGETVMDDHNKPRNAMFFDGPMGQIEVRLEGDDEA